MARYPNAIWRPTDKHGYPGNDTHLHQGLVIHSAEGSLAGLFSVLDGTREASWHFSAAQDGRVYQHIDTDRIAWTNGSQQANERFWGIECEGGGPGSPGEPLAEPQYQSLVDVVRWLWETHLLSVFRRQATLWEHREMAAYGAAATSCPSGRIPWTRLIEDLQEDEMDQNEFNKMLKVGLQQVAQAAVDEDTGKGVSGPHTFPAWMGVLVEHLHEPHGVGALPEHDHEVNTRTGKAKPTA